MGERGWERHAAKERTGRDSNRGSAAQYEQSSMQQALCPYPTACNHRNSDTHARFCWIGVIVKIKKGVRKSPVITVFFLFFPQTPLLSSRQTGIMGEKEETCSKVSLWPGFEPEAAASEQSSTWQTLYLCTTAVRHQYRCQLVCATESYSVFRVKVRLSDTAISASRPAAT